MKKYLCPACGYKYDPLKGDPDKGVKPGTDIMNIPDDLGCSVCGVDKRDFEEINESNS